MKSSASEPGLRGHSSAIFNTSFIDGEDGRSGLRKRSMELWTVEVPIDCELRLGINS